MEEQAQFHPLSYLEYLTDRIQKKGSSIFEATRAVDVERKGKQVYVKTDKGHTVRGDYLAICSHFPFYDKKGMYYSKLEPARSYTLAVKPIKGYPGGMYLSAESPKRSLRSIGDDLVLIGGEGHRTGKDRDTLSRYESLRHFTEDVFGVDEIPYRWSAPDISTVDEVPYIGRMTRRDHNIFVATGFRKWGMTNGTVAGLLLSDLITGRDNESKELYDPRRQKIKSGTQKFAATNTSVAVSMVKGKIRSAEKREEELSIDEGAVVKTVNGHIGMYKDFRGKIHRVNTTCTHMGCEVEWNNSERTWDCPFMVRAFLMMAAC